MDNGPPSPDVPGAIVVDACHLRIPGLPDWIEPTVDFLVRRARDVGAVPRERANRVMMALHEALTNSVIHGNLGLSSELKERGDEAFARAVTARCADPFYATRLVDVRMSYDGSVTRWVLTDQGAGFDVDAALRRLEQGPDPDRPSGRGLMMIRAFMNDMRYEDGGRRLTLAIRLPEEERRQHERLPWGRNVLVAPIDDEGRVDRSAEQTAWAKNISASGLSLLQSRLAEQKRVLITIPTEGESVSLQAEVRHWHDLGDGVIEVGCRFEAPPEAPYPAGGPLARLVARLTEEQQPALERRTAPRVAYTERIGVEAGPLRLLGFARDLSRSGIAFFTTVELPPGAVRLSLPQGEAEGAIHVRANVVRCTRLIDGFFDVAAQFTG